MKPKTTTKLAVEVMTSCLQYTTEEQAEALQLLYTLGFPIGVHPEASILHAYAHTSHTPVSYRHTGSKSLGPCWKSILAFLSHKSQGTMLYAMFAFGKRI